MVIIRRARRPEQKEERRDALLDAALSLFESEPFGAISVARVAAAAGLAKGTVYLYFPTRETIFLALLERELESWFAELEARLVRMRAAVRPDRVVGVIRRSLRGRETVMRLLAVLETILEQNVDFATALAFKQRLAAQVAAAGATLERRLPWLGRGGGARLLLRVNAWVIGLKQMSDPSPVVRQVLAVPGMEMFTIDFDKEFAAVLTALVRGLERRGAPKRKGTRSK